MGFWSIKYLDDFGSVEHEDLALKSYTVMGNLLRDLGTTEATEKAVQPCTRMEFLGNTFNTQKQTIEVSQHRMDALDTELTLWLHRKYAMKKQLQSLIGKLNFITNCV